MKIKIKLNAKFCMLLSLIDPKASLERFALLFSEPPSFVEELSSLEVVKGSTAAFASKVAGSAPFSVTWSKDKKAILSSQKYIIVDSEHVGLKIQDCDVDDVGTYQCVVANEVGSCSGSVVLSLKGWFYR